MRILYVHKKGAGGGSTQSLKVMMSWVEYEHELYLVNKWWRPHDRKCWLTFPRFMLSGWWRELKALRAKQSEFDVMHLNHEGLIWYAIGSRIPVVCHIRTMWPDNLWGKLFRGLVCCLSDAVICITENEQRQVPMINVIYNTAFARPQRGKR